MAYHEKQKIFQKTEIQAFLLGMPKIIENRLKA